MPTATQGIIVQVANDYRTTKKTKLQRTFVSASDAAEDRARGVKRSGGVIVDTPPAKSNKIAFVKSGQEISDKSDDGLEGEAKVGIKVPDVTSSEIGSKSEAEVRVEVERVDYLAELSNMNCLDLRQFNYNMFRTRFGRLVLLVRSWVGKLWNIQASCQVCGLNLDHNYNNVTDSYNVAINGSVIAEAKGSTKAVAKKLLGDIAWNVLKEEAVIVYVKEQFIAHNDARISVSEVSGKLRPDEFGTPIENSVATKMMKMMGWSGGGLGADSQGIAEPIKPHLQMVNRAGLGSETSDIRQIKRAGEALMRRYVAADCLDVDLVFSSEFTKEERAALHISAKKAGLVSRSYGQADRFLVVKKKLDPFSLVQAVLKKGGDTPKYRVFIPAALATHSAR